VITPRFRTIVGLISGPAIQRPSNHRGRPGGTVIRRFSASVVARAMPVTRYRLAVVSGRGSNRCTSATPGPPDAVFRSAERACHPPRSVSTIVFPLPRICALPIYSSIQHWLVASPRSVQIVLRIVQFGAGLPDRMSNVGFLASRFVAMPTS